MQQPRNGDFKTKRFEYEAFICSFYTFSVIFGLNVFAESKDKLHIQFESSTSEPPENAIELDTIDVRSAFHVLGGTEIYIADDASINSVSSKHTNDIAKDQDLILHLSYEPSYKTFSLNGKRYTIKVMRPVGLTATSLSEKSLEGSELVLHPKDAKKMMIIPQ